MLSAMKPISTSNLLTSFVTTTADNNVIQQGHRTYPMCTHTCSPGLLLMFKQYTLSIGNGKTKQKFVQKKI